MKYSLPLLAGLIDHALLHPTLTDRQLEEGCALAARWHVATVCVKPYHVPRARELLTGTGVAVSTVIGFPHGGNPVEVKCAEAEWACREGATELDMVLNIGKALSGEWDYVEQEIRAVADAAHRHGAILKVILENDFLPADDIKIRLCQICELAGADFVKTSTGFGFVRQPNGDYNTQGATDHDLRLMRASCSPKVQIKAAGGVRNLDALIRVYELGATRCGTSATAAILKEYSQRSEGQSSGTIRSNAGETLGTGGY